MPYIGEHRRFAIDYGEKPQASGELAYVLFKACREYLSARPDYQRHNDVVGALENVKAEVQRRFLAPYEDQKMKDNGDVE